MIQILRRRFLGVLLLAAAAGCAAGNGSHAARRAVRPPFAGDPYAGLDREQVLAAVATGPDRETAAAAARAELSRVFESYVVSVLDSTEQLLREAGSAGGAVLSREEVTSRIQVSTDHVLEGSGVRDVAEDGERVWARVVLPRGPAMRRIEDAFAQRSLEYASFREKAGEAEEPLEKIRWLRRAAGSLAEIDALSREHGVVDSRGRRLAMPATLEQMRAEIESVRFADLRPAIDVRGPGAEEIRVMLAEVLTDLGCRVAGERAGANLVLQGKVALEDADSVETPYGTQAFVRITLDLEIVEAATGRIVGATHVGPRRVGHRSPAEARRKALRDIVGTTRESVRELLRRHLIGEPSTS